MPVRVGLDEGSPLRGVEEFGKPFGPNVQSEKLADPGVGSRPGGRSGQREAFANQSLELTHHIGIEL